MKQEEAKELWPIVKAYSEGKTIEYLTARDEWIELKDPGFSYNANRYRIKSEPKYRPFKNADECFEEMKKHEPIGWIKRISNNEYIYIDRITQFHIGYSQIMYIGFDLAFSKFQFPDGTPFGIKDE